MSPTTDTLELIMEEVEKIPSLAGKCVKLQAYIMTMKKEKDAMKDFNCPIAKQCLDAAIKTLYEEHEKVFAGIKDRVKNEIGITDVNLSPEEMIRVFENLSLAPTNTVVQPAPANANATVTNTVVQMQQRLLLGQQSLLQMQPGSLLGQQRLLQVQAQQQILMQTQHGSLEQRQRFTQLERQNKYMHMLQQQLQLQRSLALQQRLTQQGLRQQRSLQLRQGSEQESRQMQKLQQRLVYYKKQQQRVLMKMRMEQQQISQQRLVQRQQGLGQ